MTKTKTKTIQAMASLAVVAALAVAGCGSDGSGGGYGGNESSTTTSGGDEASGAGPSGGAAVVSLASAPQLGPLLVDAEGFTLYDFHKDRGTESACYGACAKVWPPLLTEGSPKAGSGASTAKLGTTERSDGSVQVTYAGHPLYTYAADKKPGEANGQDIDSFGAEWYALQGSGAEVEG